jgi:leucyl-tRNA synthetase
MPASYDHRPGSAHQPDLVLLQVSTLLLAPITPHVSEHIWRNLLHKTGAAITAGWPATGAPDFVMQRAAQYIEDTIPALRRLIQKAEMPAKKKKGGEGPLGGARERGPAWTCWLACLVECVMVGGKGWCWDASVLIRKHSGHDTTGLQVTVSWL